MSRHAFALALTSALLACGSEPLEPDPPPVVPLAQWVFEPDTPPNGAALVLDGAVEDRRLNLRVVARDLGPIFGWRAWVRFEGQGVELSETTVAPVLEAEPSALYRTVVASRGVSFGGTRVRPSLGDVAVDGIVTTLSYERREETETEFVLDGVIVRRADGSRVPVLTAGGRLTKSVLP